MRRCIGYIEVKTVLEQEGSTGMRGGLDDTNLSYFQQYAVAHFVVLNTSVQADVQFSGPLDHLRAVSTKLEGHSQIPIASLFVRAGGKND